MKELIEITPKKFRCDVGTVCPAIFKKDNSYFIIGKKVNTSEYPTLNNRVGDDETVIEISSELINTI